MRYQGLMPLSKEHAIKNRRNAADGINGTNRCRKAFGEV